MEAKLFVSIFMLLTTSVLCADKDETTYQSGVMRIHSGLIIPGGNDFQEFCFQYPSDFYQLPKTPNGKLYRLENRTDVDPCKDIQPDQLNQNQTQIFLMRRSENCSLMNYLNYSREANAAGLIVVSRTYFIKRLDEGLDILGFVSNSTADKILNVLNPGSILQLMDADIDDSFEGSTALLWVLACFCVAVGSLTGPYYDLQGLTSQHNILENSDVRPEQKPLQLNFNVKLVLFLVVFISSVLLLLYFFFSYLVYFFMAVFCIASGRATFDILIQLLNLCKMDQRMPRIRDVGIHRILAAIICTALPITWFVLRHKDHIWILEDLLGVCFCIHLIQTLRIPNLKICSALLSLLFFYDIFFVFITPYFTSDGKSIMVEVATGAGSGETLPLLLQIPHLRNGASACLRAGFSLLGFGDIILPGFLVCFAHAYDIARGDKCRPYFITAMLGYAVGLSIAFVALYVTRIGQPALLYIVPTTLIPLYIVSLCRKQFHDIWRGAVRTSEIEP